MYLDIIEVYELPAIEMCSHGNVHVLHGCPVEPPSGIFQSFDPPHPGRPIEAEEVQEHSIHLLLHLEMEAQVDVLETSEQVFVLVHELPPRLNQSQLGIILHPDRNNKH